MGIVIRQQSEERFVELMKWGFPTWRPSKRDSSKTVADYWTNARNLTASLWRKEAASTANRCLVPAVKFAEPNPAMGKGGNSWFGMADGGMFAFAGLWKQTNDGPHYAFLTTDPNPLVAPIHPKAMPVILQRDDYSRWLDGAPATELQAPFPSQLMRLLDSRAQPTA